MPDTRLVTDERLAVDAVVRGSAEAALRAGIPVGERVGGEINEYVIVGVTDCVKRILPVRNDPEKLKRAPPYEPLAKRASELPRAPQLSPFVGRSLIDAGLLPQPAAITVRGLAVDMPATRTAGGVAGKQPGLLAIASHNTSLTIGSAWFSLDVEHIIEPGQPDFVRRDAEVPLSRLLEALGAAHPRTPIVIDELLWPCRKDGIIAFDTRFPDIAKQPKRRGHLIFRCARPVNVLHFVDLEPSTIAPGMTFRGREAGGRRTIEMTDMFGREHYFVTSAPYAIAVDAICTVERERFGLQRYADGFGACGVLTGNAQRAAAIALRATCVQIADLLIEAGLKVDPT